MSENFEMFFAGSDHPLPGRAAPLVPLRPGPLEDVKLREEIELLLDVVSTVADCPHHLTAEQVDAALRVPVGPRAPNCTDHGPKPEVDEPVPEGTKAGPSSAADRQPGAAVPGVMGDLFEREPENWHAPSNSCHRDVWNAMLSRLASEPVPPNRRAVERVLTDTFRAVVGVDLHRDPLPEPSKHVYRLHVTENQTSSGVVDVEEWKHRLIPLLISRTKRTDPTA